ncbi:MAG: low affinity iron permease family protein, partial [Microvirga sp.]
MSEAAMWLSKTFTDIATHVAHASGRPFTFVAAILIILVWAITGPMFGYSDTWQLIINTGTTIVTFLMVFLIQNSQNRDFKAMNLKLDELIRGTQGARTGLVALEEMSDEDLERLHKQYLELQDRRSAQGDAAPPAGH